MASPHNSRLSIIFETYLRLLGLNFLNLRKLKSMTYIWILLKNSLKVLILRVAFAAPMKIPN